MYKVQLKHVAFIYYLIDMILQYNMLFMLPGYLIFSRFSMHNTFLSYCFLSAAFEKSNFIAKASIILAIVVMLLTIISFVGILLGKINFYFIPLIVILLNIIFHIIFIKFSLITSIGLIYKIIGLFIYSFTLYQCYKRKSKKTQR